MSEKMKEKDKNREKPAVYIARGLLEFRMNVDVGGAVLRICFSGGAMGLNGVVPAKYETANEALQRIIEDSPQFKSGRIKRLR